MSRTAAGNVLAFITACVVFAFFVFALGTGWIWAAVAAVVAYGLALLIVPGLPSRRRPETVGGLSREYIDQTLDEAEDAVRRIRRTSRRVSDAEVRRGAHAACTTADKIIAELRRDPTYIQSVRRFLNYYVDATDRILERYLELSRRKSDAESVQSALARVAPALQVVNEAFERQYEGLLHHDVLDLDAEVMLLQKSAKMDGLIEAPAPVEPPSEELRIGEMGETPTKAETTQRR